MQADAVHGPVHDKGRTGHVAGIFEQRDEQIENEDIGQEHDHSAHTAQRTVDQHVAPHAFGHAQSDKLRQLADQPFYPLHGIGSQLEGGVEHDKEGNEKQREAQQAVGHDAVYALGQRTSGLDGLRLVGFAQRALHEAVFGIGQRAFGCLVQFVRQSLGLFEAYGHQLIVLRQLFDQLAGLGIAFQKLDG